MLFSVFSCSFSSVSLTLAIASATASKTRKCPQTRQRAHRRQPGACRFDPAARARHVEALPQCSHRLLGACDAPPRRTFRRAKEGQTCQGCAISVQKYCPKYKRGNYRGMLGDSCHSSLVYFFGGGFFCLVFLAEIFCTPQPFTFSNLIRVAGSQKIYRVGCRESHRRPAEGRRSSVEHRSQCRDL